MRPGQIKGHFRAFPAVFQRPGTRKIGNLSDFSLGTGPPESFDQKVLNFFLRLTEIVLGVHDPVLLHF